jgi:hypothetical protein
MSTPHSRTGRPRSWALVEAGTLPFTAAFKRVDGTGRTLTGYLASHEDLLGRSMVRDLEAEGDGIRQVDYRTLEWLVLDGVKYIVKGA